MSETTFRPCDGFTRATLEQHGFVGWEPMSNLLASLAVIDREAAGVYVVYRANLDPRAFLATSPAGRFRGDPTVPVRVLKANGVPNANVIYIGQAGPRRLRQRLRELEGFGRGTRHRHWGGRLLWQLSDSVDALVAWKTISRGSPRALESTMLAAFRHAYGRAPFANDPHLLGD